VKEFIRSCFDVVSKRGNLLTLFNTIYFCSFFIVVLVVGLLSPPALYSDEAAINSWNLILDDWLITIAGIFIFNVVVSAFVIVTLPGMLFVPLSAAFLVFRAILWGLIFYPLSSWTFLTALPTMVLEGEAYVFAAASGTIVGLSWIKPKWLFRGEESSRKKAFTKALGEAKQLYKAVALLLLIAALVETITILSF
jgi:hypothetical protein